MLLSILTLASDPPLGFHHNLHTWDDPQTFGHGPLRLLQGQNFKVNVLNVPCSLILYI